MISIVSVDKDWEISANCAYVQKIKASLKQFKELTINKIVVMDKDMLELLPKKEALKNRINICYCEEKDFKKEGFLIANTKDQLFELLGFYNSENVFFVGSEKLYDDILPYCHKVIVFKFVGGIKTSGTLANLDRKENWKLVKTSEPFFEDNILYYVCEYKNLLPDKYNYGYEKEDII